MLTGSGGEIGKPERSEHRIVLLGVSTSGRDTYSSRLCTIMQHLVSEPTPHHHLYV